MQNHNLLSNSPGMLLQALAKVKFFAGEQIIAKSANLAKSPGLAKHT